MKRAGMHIVAVVAAAAAAVGDCAKDNDVLWRDL